LTENISNLIVAATSLCGGIVVALLAGMAIWTFRDIRSRTRDPLAQILATVMVAVIPIAGILVYFMLRPRETLSEKYVRSLEEESLLASVEDQEFCPTCGRRVDADMQFCPSCQTKLRNACGNCGRAVHLSWAMCPYCGSGLTPEMPVTSVKKPSPKRVTQPAQGAQSIAAKQTPAQTSRLGIGSMLDRVGDAIGSVVDKVTPTRTDDDTSTTQPTEAIPPVSTPNGNGSPPRSIAQPSQARKPLISREELE